MKTYLDPRDVELMEKCAGSARDKLLVRLLFRLGCRVSEVLNLKVADIDFEQATITILHLKTRSRLTCPDCKASLARRHRFCPECGKEVRQIINSEREQKRIRVLPIEKNTLNLLKDYVVRDKPVSADNTWPIFRINRHRAWQIVRDCAKRAGLPNLVNPETVRVRGVSPHRLRDAFSVHAMKLDDSGDSLRVLQEHLGHTSFNTTAKYRKIAGEEHRSWYDRLWHDFGKL
jgi:integrase/recombinase XerD